MAGIESQLCWSASLNEIRVHTTESLSSHVGHGTSGLPTLATFRFFSKPVPLSFESLPGTDTSRERVRRTPPPWMSSVFSSPRTHGGDIGLRWRRRTTFPALARRALPSGEESSRFEPCRARKCQTVGQFWSAWFPSTTWRRRYAGSV